MCDRHAGFDDSDPAAQAVVASDEERLRGSFGAKEFDAVDKLRFGKAPFAGRVFALPLATTFGCISVNGALRVARGVIRDAVTVNGDARAAVFGRKVCANAAVRSHLSLSRDEVQVPRRMVDVTHHVVNLLDDAIASGLYRVPFVISQRLVVSKVKLIDMDVEAAEILRTRPDAPSNGVSQKL